MAHVGVTRACCANRLAPASHPPARHAPRRRHASHRCTPRRRCSAGAQHAAEEVRRGRGAKHLRA
eukprot:5178385-Prymnesium_polylepis.2